MSFSKSLLTALVALTLSFSLAGCQLIGQSIPITPKADEQLGSTSALTARFLYVVDGDTIAVAASEQLPATNAAGTVHTVRVLSIDSPELNSRSAEAAECGAEDAKNSLMALLSVEQDVTLIFDANSDRVDRYGRSLAYVETTGDHPVDIGLEQVRAGMAGAWYPKGAAQPERFDAYREVEQAAAAAGAGAAGVCSAVGR